MDNKVSNGNDSTLNKALSAGLWYTISNVTLRAISIITAPIFTRLLATSDYGIVNIFTSWQNIFVIFIGLGLSYSIGRAKIDFSDDFDGYLSSIQGLSTIVGLVFLAVMTVGQNFFSEVLKLDPNLVVTLFVYLIFFPSVEYVQAKFRFAYRYKVNVAIAAYSTLSTVIVSIILILYSPWNRYTSRIYGMVFPSLLLAIGCWAYISKRGKKLFNVNYWKYALRISLPMIPHSLAMVVLGQIDRIMIGSIVGESEAGIYSFGYSYAVIGSVIINAIGQAWQPWLYDRLKEKKIDSIKKASAPLSSLVLVFTIGFIALAPEAIMILGAPDYWDAKWMVAPVAIGTFYQFIYSNFSNVELYTKKTAWIAVGSVMAAILNYVLNAIFIPIYGYNIAAVTSMVGYLALMVFHWIFARVTFGQHVYDNKSVLLHCILTTGIGLMMMYLYNWTIIRYIALIIFLAVAYLIYRTELKSYYTKLKLKRQSRR